ncbi:MAG: SpoIIE family protein phosphatase [Candidatus Riflebacteria bacterium]
MKKPAKLHPKTPKKQVRWKKCWESSNQLMICIQEGRAIFKRLNQVFNPRPVFLVGGAFLMLLFAMIFFPSTTRRLENFLFDVKQKVASNFREPDSSLVVVGIDIDSMQEGKNRWPWPREEIAELVDLLGSLEPKGILIDILFQNSDSEIGDQALAGVFRRLGNIVLISILQENVSDSGTSLSRFNSIDCLVKSSRAQGFVWGLLDTDGFLRRFKISDSRLDADSAALVAVKNFYNISSDHLNNLPETAPVVFARKNGGIPVISILDIRKTPDFYRSFCQGKFLILGVNAQVAHDYHNTALGFRYGSEILAASIDTILSARVGLVYHDNTWFRTLSVAAGLIGCFFLIMGNYSLAIISCVFAAVVFLLMLFSEILLIHVPIAPFFQSWVISGILFAGARYFDNLFVLQEMRLESSSATLVQDQLLPDQELEAGEYKVFGLSKSASAIGGDYFDYFFLEDRYLLVIIGDATGHGIPAALGMAIGKAAVLMSLENKLSPAKMIEAVNLILFRSLRRKLMMTMAVLWLDIQTGEFEYRNCGHPYPYFFAADGSVRQISAAGLFLGTRPGYKLSEPHKGVLQPGERILLYSDGLVEAMLTASKEDAYESFRLFLADRPRLPIQEACRDIIESHPHFRLKKPQPDDFTAVLLERTGIE